nr:hypothetical protein [Acidisoma silvae]
MLSACADLHAASRFEQLDDIAVKIMRHGSGEGDFFGAISRKTQDDTATVPIPIQAEKFRHDLAHIGDQPFDCIGFGDESAKVIAFRPPNGSLSVPMRHDVKDFARCFGQTHTPIVASLPDGMWRRFPRA